MEYIATNLRELIDRFTAESAVAGHHPLCSIYVEGDDLREDAEENMVRLVHRFCCVRPNILIVKGLDFGDELRRSNLSTALRSRRLEMTIGMKIVQAKGMADAIPLCSRRFAAHKPIQIQLVVRLDSV